jgi:hypothetical protein
VTGLYRNSSFDAVQNYIAQYYAGSPVQASAGDRLTLGLTPLNNGVFTAYLQRFAPTGGSCTAIPAVGARINLMKFTLVTN